MLDRPLACVLKGRAKRGVIRLLLFYALLVPQFMARGGPLTNQCYRLRSKNVICTPDEVNGVGQLVLSHPVK